MEEGGWGKNKVFVVIIVAAIIVAGVVIALAILAVGFGLVRNNKQAQSGVEQADGEISVCLAKEYTTVTRVIDGDTIVVEGGYSVRLLEMDTDEKGYPCYKLAKAELEKLVLNKQVRLEKEQTDTDKYKRCLRNVFVGDMNVGLEMVKMGFAIARFYEPDIKYKNEITLAEKTAIDGKLGCKWNVKNK